MYPGSTRVDSVGAMNELVSAVASSDCGFFPAIPRVTPVTACLSAAGLLTPDW